MGQTLRIAAMTDSYTLTDRATFDAFGGTLRCFLLHTGGARLLNTYAVIADSANVRGLRFAQRIADGAGRRALNSILTRQVKGFLLWPDDVRADIPEADPRQLAFRRSTPLDQSRLIGVRSGRDIEV